ncbi:endonuclease/exonuclease/phosphatase family protein [Fodinicurvata halophila]
MQLAALLALVFLLCLAAFDWHQRRFWFLAGAVLACLVYQSARMLPYTGLWPEQAVSARQGQCSEDSRLSLMISNVLQDNRDSQAVLDRVGEYAPDLLLLIETNGWWAEAMAPLEEEYKEVVAQPQENKYGLLLFSRLDLIEPQVRRLVEEEVPSIHSGVRLPSGVEVVFYGLHPRPPEPKQDTEERDAELVLVGREAREVDVPAIVAGDLNDVAWSDTTRLFQELSGLLDPRIGRSLYSSYHAQWPILRWPIDHVFFSPDFTLLRMSRLEPVGSDHFPILVELCHQPANEGQSNSPDAEPEDQKEARETIEEGREAEKEE